MQILIDTPPKTNMVHLKMGAPWKFGDSYWFHHHFQVPAVNFWGVCIHANGSFPSLGDGFDPWNPRSFGTQDSNTTGVLGPPNDGEK